MRQMCEAQGKRRRKDGESGKRLRRMANIQYNKH